MIQRTGYISQKNNFSLGKLYELEPAAYYLENRKRPLRAKSLFKSSDTRTTGRPATLLIKIITYLKDIYNRVKGPKMLISNGVLRQGRN
jgi:hypothetical protein